LGVRPGYKRINPEYKYKFEIKTEKETKKGDLEISNHGRAICTRGLY